jgi:hypothetical protein
MDIKVLCPCGTKYQFPVEPVNGGLPHPIACPVCGADNTEAGNAAILSGLAAEPAPIPTATALPSGIRISAQPAAQSHAPHTQSAAPTAFPMSQPVRKRGSGTADKAKKIGGLAVTTVLVIFGACVLYNKWSKRVGGVANLVSAIAGSDESGSGDTRIRWTLPDDDAGVMLVKSVDYTSVAKAFVAAYSQVTKQNLTIATASDEFDEEASFAICPARKGAVSIMGPMEWPEPQASALGAALSKQLNTIVVVALMGDDAETGLVSIYESGERRFFLKRWYQIASLSEDGLKEFMERDGEGWATEHGYVPSPAKVLTGDTDAIPFEDVNDLVLKLGMDASDAPEEIKGILILKPNTPAQ